MMEMFETGELQQLVRPKPDPGCGSLRPGDEKGSRPK